MARGGYRPGAGRPRKTDDGQAVKSAKAAVKVASVDVSEPVVFDVPACAVTPLEYLLSVVNDLEAAEGDRFRAAVAAAPYVHVRASDLAAAKGKKEQKQEAAEAAARGKFAPRVGPKLAVVKG